VGKQLFVFSFSKNKVLFLCWLKKMGAQQNLSVKRLSAVAGGL
jgi:hypothetical protein